MLETRTVRDCHEEFAVGHLIQCPACENEHLFRSEPGPNGAKWSFNGDYIKPTFTPSMMIRVRPMPKGHPQEGQWDVCHSFVTDGKIRYLPDCTHEMAGKTVDLEPYDFTPAS
jgi:hypothetical protein